MLNDLSSPAAYLASRRSGKPRDLGEPGPDAAALERMLGVAARTPDHGKLAPWRFFVVDDRDAFARLLADALAAEKPDAKAFEQEAAEQFARQAPCLVVVVSEPDLSKPIPLWEQQLSAGAACLNLVAAAGAEGFAGGWLSGWPAYSETVRRAFTEGADARIAGFVFIGTPTRPLDERPRPAPGEVVRRWPAR